MSVLLTNSDLLPKCPGCSRVNSVGHKAKEIGSNGAGGKICREEDRELTGVREKNQKARYANLELSKNQICNKKDP